jgi:hypothetical protein
VDADGMDEDGMDEDGVFIENDFSSSRLVSEQEVSNIEPKDNSVRHGFKLSYLLIVHEIEDSTISRAGRV